MTVVQHPEWREEILEVNGQPIQDRPHDLV